jgi:hypothetical protein
MITSHVAQLKHPHAKIVAAQPAEIAHQALVYAKLV